LLTSAEASNATRGVQTAPDRPDLQELVSTLRKELEAAVKLSRKLLSDLTRCNEELEALRDLEFEWENSDGRASTAVSEEV
jgi:hypothetical protein